MYCCTGFANLVSCAGERGLAILACEISPGQVAFFFQSRGLAFGDEKKWKPVPVELKINVSSEVGLRYCPFCSRKLEELVQESPDSFKELAERHKQFLASMPGL